MNEETKEQEITELIEENEKMVPVSESVKYRRRAQIAEKKHENTEKLMDSLIKENQRLDRELKDSRRDQQILSMLEKEGVIDSEAALLLTRSRMKQDSIEDAIEAVKELKDSKRYLFLQNNINAAELTNGIKEPHETKETEVARMAEEAATSGSREALYEYMRARRNLI